MGNVLLILVFGLLGGVAGMVALGEEGALLGVVIGGIAARLVRLGERLDRLEAELARRVATAPVAPGPAQPELPQPTAAATEPAAAAPGASVATPALTGAAQPADADEATPASPEPPVMATIAPRAPGAITRSLAWLRNYATTGNVVAKAGVLLLFFGVSFLLKYAIDRDALPIEVRLAGTAAAAIALIVTGWRLRDSRTAFGLVLQGGGIGLLYLTVFAAARLYGVLPLGLTFALLLALVALSSLLAVMQDARALAVLGTVGGFLAPVLTSTGSGSHVALFSYYALLNAGIVGIAWFKAWRILNLTGFVFTFVIGAAWGERYYQPEFFATTEPFLVLSFLFYLAVSVLFALRHPPRLKGYVDGTLVFGLPLVVFALQAPLVRDIEFGRAWSAFGMGAIYLGLAAWLRQRAIAQLGMLVEALVALGVVAASLAIPFAFDGHLTAAAWALEGAGLVWIGVRQHRLRARLFGVLLQLAAGTAYFAIVAGHPRDALPVLNAQYLGCAFVAAGALFASYLLAARRTALRDWEIPVAPLLLCWGLLWWYGAGLHEIGLYVAPAYEPAASLAFFGASSALLAWGATRLDWRQAALASALHAPLALLIALLMYADTTQRDFLAAARPAGWCVMLAAAWYTAWRTASALPRSLLRVNHAVSLWFTLFLLAWCAASALARIDGGGAWSLAAWAAVAIAALVLLPHAGRPAWPLARFSELYRGAALLPVAGYVLCWVLVTSANSGEPHPLPFLPLANPLDLASASAVLAVLLWWRQARRLAELPAREALARVIPAAVAATGFLWLNVAAARAVHALAGVGYSLYWLHRSAVFQGTISVLWGVTALAVMVGATRRGVRVAWLCGAVLLAALVLKLFLIDLGDRGTVARIVSFIAAGGLMVLIGYLSPAPPRKPSEATA